jgi:hypothetical protein
LANQPLLNPKKTKRKTTTMAIIKEELPKKEKKFRPDKYSQILLN